MRTLETGLTLSNSIEQSYLAVCVLTSLFGLFLVLGAGFVGPEVIHNAAHDVRHAMAFPCH